MIGIYEVLNTINNKRYIGSSKHIKYRLRQHKHSLRDNKHHNRHLQAAWNKYGSESFVIQQIVECSIDDLEFYEQLIIDGYKSNQKEFGYNIRLAASSNRGAITSRTTNKPGDRFNKLTLIEPREIKNRRRFWLCECECGVSKEISVVDVRKGHTKSCGCIQSERQRTWLKEQHKKGPWNKRLYK